MEKKLLESNKEELRGIMKDSVIFMEILRKKVDIWKTGHCLMFFWGGLLSGNKKGE